MLIGVQVYPLNFVFNNIINNLSANYNWYYNNNIILSNNKNYNINYNFLNIMEEKGILNIRDSLTNELKKYSNFSIEIRLPF